MSRQTKQVFIIKKCPITPICSPQYITYATRRDLLPEDIANVNTL